MKYRDFIICRKCFNACDIDGEYPKFHSFCDFCKTEPKGFDCSEYAVNYIQKETYRVELLLNGKNK